MRSEESRRSWSAVFTSAYPRHDPTPQDVAPVRGVLRLEDVECRIRVGDDVGPARVVGHGGESNEVGRSCRGFRASAPGLEAESPDKGGAMSITSRDLFSAAMDVEPAKAAIFNEVYDREHVPNLLTVPGVIAVARF